MTAFFLTYLLTFQNLLHMWFTGVHVVSVGSQRGTADADPCLKCVENIGNNHTGDVFKIVHRYLKI